MDNQDSNPQIIIPNVPDDFCPSGDWRNIFQTFVDTVLANGTVNIPDLSDISPAAIVQLQTDVTNLQTDVSTLQGDVINLQTDVTALQSRPIVTIRTGIIAVAAGNSTINITFAAVPSAGYGVVITPVGTATAVAAGKYILQTGQTSTGFTILVNDNPATVTEIRWTVIHTN
jgi:uncharacterized protein YlxW (UPF0749 family)